MKLLFDQNISNVLIKSQKLFFEFLNRENENAGLPTFLTTQHHRLHK
jgi:hypothetical protein